MFDTLTRKKQIRTQKEVNLVIPFKGIALSSENIRHQRVDSFTGKISYQGTSIMQFSLNLLSLLAREMEISQGAFFISELKDGKPVLKFLSGYAIQSTGREDDILEFGEGFPGQVAKDGNLINISDIPEGYLCIESGLGKGSPESLIIFPVKDNEKVLAVIELASFHKFTSEDELFFCEISSAIAEQIVKCGNKF